jgi:hypothetical protein
MLSKQHAISISVCIIFSALILVSPAFSQDTPAHFTLQLLHAADLESGVEALENAPRFSAVLNALKAEEENTVIIGAGDTYIPGAFFAAGKRRSRFPTVLARARSSPPLQAKKSVLSVQRRHGSEPYHRRVMSELCPRTEKIFRRWRRCCTALTSSFPAVRTRCSRITPTACATVTPPPGFIRF